MTTNTATSTAKIAATIREQATFGSLSSLGARDFRHGNIASVKGAEALPSLMFNATILPFTKNGKRAGAARNMHVVISLTPADDYNILVTYRPRGDRYGFKPSVVHFEADTVYGEDLARFLLALDYDGDDILNPRLA